MKQSQTITEPFLYLQHIENIFLSVFSPDGLKLWGSSVCCEGSSIFGGFPLKGMVGPIAFLSGKQEKQGGLPYKEAAPCPVQAGYGAASSYFEGNRELHAVKRMGHEAGGPFAPSPSVPGTYFKQEKIGPMGAPCASSRACSHYAELFQWLKRVGRNFQHRKIDNYL